MPARGDGTKKEFLATNTLGGANKSWGVFVWNCSKNMDCFCVAISTLEVSWQNAGGGIIHVMTNVSWQVLLSLPCGIVTTSVFNAFESNGSESSAVGEVPQTKVRDTALFCDGVLLYNSTWGLQIGYYFMPVFWFAMLHPYRVCNLKVHTSPNVLLFCYQSYFGFCVLITLFCKCDQLTAEALCGGRFKRETPLSSFGPSNTSSRSLFTTLTLCGALQF